MAVTNDTPDRRDIKKIMDRAAALRKRAVALYDTAVGLERESQERLDRVTKLIEAANELYKSAGQKRKQL